jgi:hypothetical protein
MGRHRKQCECCFVGGTLGLILTIVLILVLLRAI